MRIEWAQVLRVRVVRKLPVQSAFLLKMKALASSKKLTITIPQPKLTASPLEQQRCWPVVSQSDLPV